MTTTQTMTHMQAQTSTRWGQRLVTVLGATSTGKTSLAIDLCKQFHGEIVSADSRQIYKYADVGTNKERSTVVPIHLYDVVEPDEEYSASRFIDDAAAIVQNLWQKGKLPFVVGGTGFYISALLGEVELSGVPANPQLRQELSELSVDELQDKLRKLDMKRFGRMDRAGRSNPHRLIRATEIAIAQTNDQGFPSQKTSPLYLKIKNSNLKILKIGLRAPRKETYHRADRWAHRLVMSGTLIEETEDLLNRGYRETKLMQGIIYAPAVEFIDGKIADKTELVQTIQGQLHDYIRRQLRWFKRMEGVHWFDVSQAGYEAEVAALISKWYSGEDKCRNSN